MRTFELPIKGRKNNIKLWRKERGFSQEELAAASGVPRYVNQQTENGILFPEASVWLKWAIGLGVDPFVLVSDKGEIPTCKECGHVIPCRFENVK